MSVSVLLDEVRNWHMRSRFSLAKPLGQLAMLRWLACLTLVLSPSLLAAQQTLPNYKQWRSACAKLPSNRDLKGELPDKKRLPLPAFADFERALDAFLRVEREGPLADAKTWVADQPDPKVFFNFAKSWYGGNEIPFQPFAAKLVLPNDAIAIIMGDLHGDVRSLLRTLDELNERKILDGFRFREPKYRFLFLGDFTDRGAYGTEVLYTLFCLKAANPDRVHFAGATMRISTSRRGTGFSPNSSTNTGNRPTSRKSCDPTT
jgi:hypothetical protein